MTVSRREAAILLEKLKAGTPPPPRMALATLAGFDGLLAEWTCDLERYVRRGGSLLRILTAQVGTGKTHLARALQALAADRRFLVCQIDAAAQHTDDDLALLEAFCDGLTDPDALFDNEAETGLRSILERTAAASSPGTLREHLRRARVPVAGVCTVLPGLVAALSTDSRPEMMEDDIDVTVRVLSGHLVEGTRSISRLRRSHPGPLLRKLGRSPGKRDARLWLESLLRAIPALGYSGVLWILDEHDEASRRVMDRHIVQLRRLADRLSEGRLPGVFVVYLVLEDFPSRIREAHGALDQRLRPVLTGTVRRRAMVPVSEVRDVGSEEFLWRVAERIQGLVHGEALSAESRSQVKEFVRRCNVLGGANTRGFVQAFCSLIDVQS